MNCLGCLREDIEGYCKKCLKKLFDGRNIKPVLPFNSPFVDNSEIFHDNTKRISISGVQLKYSLKIVDDELLLTEKEGAYILKPIPVGTFRYLDQAPMNEHLTMQIAKIAYHLHVPANALIRFKDGSLAYLVRRFDRHSDGKKIQQEDFAQIAQMTSETHGNNYKYDLSYEEIATLIQAYIPTYKIELEKFIRMILFNYVMSNGDAHLKNFSAIRSEQGDFVLTPAYDLLTTKIHSPSESDMALTLFKEGFTPAYETYGYYTYEDFHQFGTLIGIKENRLEKILEEFKKPNEKVYQLVNHSFLNSELKHLYYDLYLDRINRFNQRLDN